MNTRDEKLKVYLKKVQDIFSQIDVSSAFSIYSGEAPTSGKIIFSNQSDAFKKKFEFSNYKNIIHYTSMDNMISILNSQTFRLYNCLNLNDPKEIEYANTKFNFGLTEHEISTFKQNSFVSSFCEYDMNKQNDDFNLWRLYGNQGLGVGLVFEIENMKDSWEEVYIGKISYNENDAITKQFSGFIRFHNEFNQQYQLFDNTPSFFPAITLHFKDEIWKTENEIRLFAHCPFDKYELEPESFESQNHYLSTTLEHTINKSGRLVSYISLPLNRKRKLLEFKNCGISENEGNVFLSCIPHFKLKRIVLGYNVPSKVRFNIDKILNWLIDKNEMDFVELEYSLLREKLGTSNFKDSDD